MAAKSPLDAGTERGLLAGMDVPGANLRFVDADRLRALDGELNHAVVRGAADAVLGTLTGALIDPLQRRVCFLVVESGSWLMRRHYALPIDAARVDRERHGLLMDVDGDMLREVDAGRFPRFSDADVLDAMFSPRAA
jgi:hypothetical protein